MSKKISELETLRELLGDELFVVVDGNSNYNTTLYDILDFIRSNLTKYDVGLGNVDNTSDLEKPISLATQAALDQKSPLVHDHPDYIKLVIKEW